MTTGQKLILARTEAKLTQAQAARILRLHRQALNAYERDRRRPRQHRLTRLITQLAVVAELNREKKVLTRDTSSR